MTSWRSLATSPDSSALIASLICTPSGTTDPQNLHLRAPEGISLRHSGQGRTADLGSRYSRSLMSGRTMRK